MLLSSLKPLYIFLLGLEKLLLLFPSVMLSQVCIGTRVLAF